MSPTEDPAIDARKREETLDIQSKRSALEPPIDEPLPPILRSNTASHSDPQRQPIPGLAEARRRIDYPSLAASVIERHRQHGALENETGDMLVLATEAAARGDPEAAYLVGHILLNGIGTATDIDRALDNLEYAALHNYSQAMVELGWLHAEGRGVLQDFETANAWYQLAVSQSGNPEAALFLGQALWNGWGTDPSPNDALEYYRFAAHAGNLDAQYALALRLSEIGDPAFLDEMNAWYQLAADSGHPRASFDIAFKKAREGDTPAAVDYLKSSLEGGLTSAALALAFLPTPESDYGAPPQVDPEALDFLRTLAEEFPAEIGLETAHVALTFQSDYDGMIRLLQKAGTPRAKLALNLILHDNWDPSDAIKHAARLPASEAYIENGRVSQQFATDSQSALVQPRPIMITDIRVPDVMIELGLDQTIPVKMVVDADGNVVNPQIEEPVHPAIAEPVLEAIKNWKFEPGRQNGVPMPARVVVPVRIRAR